MIERYGVENPSQLQKIKDKKRETYLEHLGVEHPSQSKIIKEKIKQTSKEHYGVEYPSQSQEIKEKVKQTNLERRGVEYSLQSKEVQSKIKQIMKDRYGKENYSQTSEGRRISRETAIKSIETQQLNGEPLTPRIGSNERSCLNELQNLINYQILRQQKFIGFFLDGYIKELNLVIEFDESHHFQNGILLEQDQFRQKELTTHLNCIFFRIKESDWLENPDDIKKRFVELCPKEILSEILRQGQKNN